MFSSPSKYALSRKLKMSQKAGVFNFLLKRLSLPDLLRASDCLDFIVILLSQNEK